MATRRARVVEAARSSGADWALLTRPESVTYATRVEPPVDITLPLFAGGPVTVLIAPDERCGIAASARSLPSRLCSQDDLVVRAYAASSTDPPALVAERHVAAVKELWRHMGAPGRVAVEGMHLPWAIGCALSSLATDLVAFDLALADARAIKAPDEVESLRHSAAVAQKGQKAARTAAAAGASELDVMAAARAAMDHAAGHRVTLTADLLSGSYRTSLGGGGPVARVLQEGDPVLVDLAPRVRGYWGDSCSAFVVGGEPTRDWQRLHRSALEGLIEGIDATRAGITAAQLDERVRSAVGRIAPPHAHHTGHGIGVAHHEVPRLIASSREELRSGMVLTLEPGAYDRAVGGVRLEAVVVVTDDGCEVLAAPPEISS
jgi:Xaa-Pro dipeptidase